MKDHPARRFVAVEGLDGSGKTTLVTRLANALTRSGIDVTTTAGPWNEGVAGNDLNAIIRMQERECSPEVLALLFAANRADQSSLIVEPTLSSCGDSVVIADRHILSGFAYQMMGGVDEQWLKAINAHARWPDIVLFVDTPPEVCWHRIAKRGMKTELFEAELDCAYNFFRRAITLLEVDGLQTVFLDGMNDPDAIVSSALEYLRPQSNSED